ncbi:MAG: hypothetical protein AAB393_12870 [Bacteroidota bacterium]
MEHRGFRQALVWLLITAHLITISACTTTERLTLPGNEIPLGSDYRIASVILKDGEVVQFDSKGGRYVEKAREGKSYRAIVGTAQGRDVEIDPDKVLEVRFEQKESRGGGSFIVGFLLGLPVGALGLYLVLLAAYSGH